MNVNKYSLLLRENITGKILVTGFFILIFVSCIVNVADLYLVNKNLMVNNNPGFEDSSKLNNLERVSTNPRSGSYCGKQVYTAWNQKGVSGDFSGNFAYLSDNSISGSDIIVGRRYCLSVWNKNTFSTGDICIGMEFKDSSGAVIERKYKKIPNNSTLWQLCEMEFITAAGTTQINPFFFIESTVVADPKTKVLPDVYWDDIVIELVNIVSGDDVISIKPSAVYASAYGNTRDSMTINASIKALSSKKKTLILDGADWVIDKANVSIPSNIVLMIKAGTAVYIAKNHTLTINGQVNLSAGKKFYGPGNVIMNNSAVEAIPQWWGAIADNKTDCAPAMRSAIASGAKNIYLSSGIYLMKTRGKFYANSQEYLFKLHSNINIYGDGMRASIMKMDDGVLMKSLTPLGSGVFLVENVENISFKNFTIAMNGKNNMVPKGTRKACYAIRTTSANNVVVEGMHFKNTPGRSYIVFSKGTKNVVRSCYILNSGTSLAGNIAQDDFSAIYVDSTHTICEKNIIRNEKFPFDGSGGIEMHAPNTICQQNYIARSHPAVYIHVDGRETSTNMTFQDNFAIECLQGVCIGGAIIEGTPGGVLDKVSVKNNYFSLKQFTSSKHLEGVYSYAVYLSNGAPGHFMNLKMTNSIISGNTMDDLDKSASNHRSLFFIGGGLQGVTISNNIINKTSGDAIVLYGNPYDLIDVTISGNTIKSFGMNSNISRKKKRFAISFNLPNKSVYPSAGYFNAKNVQIINNTINRDSNSDYAWAFYFNWNNSSVITDLLVKGNAIKTNVLPNIKYGLKAGFVDILP